MQFDFPEVVDPLIVEGDPEQSYARIGLSLLLPYLEPYLIRTMRAARPQVNDARLLADLDAFNGQEGQHYRQHRAFNASIRRAGFAGLEGLEREVEADYQRFTRDKSLAWNLAFAEGFEALTTASARFSFERGLDGMLPAARDLFTWYLVEEFEH
jgi:predicted metal-dependent hydrolase